MAKTPRRALAAVTAAGEEVGGVRVRELTLGLAAVLERIGSPLVCPRPEGSRPTLGGMVPTLYVMTRPAAESEELLADGCEALEREAVRWADGLSTAHGLALAAACARSAERAARVAPQGAAGNGCAAGTAG
jgi:hypothetical protein